MSNQSKGLGFFSTLTLIFVTLKLTGVISWSWWLVLLPSYWLIVLGLFILLLAPASMLIDQLMKEK